MKYVPLHNVFIFLLMNHIHPNFLVNGVAEKQRGRFTSENEPNQMRGDRTIHESYRQRHKYKPGTGHQGFLKRLARSNNDGPQCAVMYKNNEPVGILQPYEESYRFLPVKGEPTLVDINPIPVKRKTIMDVIYPSEIADDDDSRKVSDTVGFSDEKFPSVFAKFRIDSRLSKSWSPENYMKRSMFKREQDNQEQSLEPANPQMNLEDVAVEDELKTILDDMGLIDDYPNRDVKRAIEDENLEFGTNKINLFKEEHTESREKRDDLNATDIFIEAPSNTTVKFAKFHDSKISEDTGNEVELNDEDTVDEKRQIDEAKDEISSSDYIRSDEIESEGDSPYETRIERAIRDKIHKLKEEVKKEIDKLRGKKDDKKDEKTNENNDEKKGDKKDGKENGKKDENKKEQKDEKNDEKEAERKNEKKDEKKHEKKDEKKEEKEVEKKEGKKEEKVDEKKDENKKPISDDTRRKKRQTINTLIEAENKDIDPMSFNDEYEEVHVRRKRNTDFDDVETSEPHLKKFEFKSRSLKQSDVNILDEGIDHLKQEDEGNSEKDVVIEDDEEDLNERSDSSNNENGEITGDAGANSDSSHEYDESEFENDSEESYEEADKAKNDDTKTGDTYEKDTCNCEKNSNDCKCSIPSLNNRQPSDSQEKSDINSAVEAAESSREHCSCDKTGNCKCLSSLLGKPESAVDEDYSAEDDEDTSKSGMNKRDIRQMSSDTKQHCSCNKNGNCKCGSPVDEPEPLLDQDYEAADDALPKNANEDLSEFNKDGIAIETNDDEEPVASKFSRRAIKPRKEAMKNFQNGEYFVDFHPSRYKFPMGETFRRKRDNFEDMVAIHGGGAVRAHLAAVRERSMLPFPRQRSMRRVRKEDNNSEARQLIDMSDEDIFGALPQGFEGGLQRYKRVKRT
ncbi:unnamed protein product [Phaedon cochleariae]|uniref:Uncharacterized protein n=1 Tax=Phaedon cochleariae TaxID=80249 RepID=A0A9P0DPF3_PHACE|nr:unnamed protein product [Phaedon cochleariae]